MKVLTSYVYDVDQTIDGKTEEKKKKIQEFNKP